MILRLDQAVWVLLGWVALGGFVEAQESTKGKKNVLFIAVDDLNDWIGCLGGHPQARTPNMDRLAARGTLFASAHCNAPLCNSSRSSLLLGLRPSTTGIYALKPNFRSLPKFETAVTIPEHFQRNGYQTAITGKIFHGGSQAYMSGPIDYGPRNLVGLKPPQKLVTTPMGNHPLVDWGTFPHNDEDRGDYETATWACEKIASWQSSDEPQFLAAGFFLPHVPLYAPPKWFEMFPLETLKMPTILDSDREDTPEFSWYKHWKLPEPRLSWLREHGQLEPIVQAYLASTAYVDSQIGRVLDALEAAGKVDNTVVVLWSDHGWHLGEKAISGKNSLWEESTRVPLMFAGPGVQSGQICQTPVELLDIYPTLIELTGVAGRGGLEGLSLVPQLRDPAARRERPAITTHNQNNHGVRTVDWRYISYADGSEELYDLREDPNEWHNLADKPELSGVKERLASWLPQMNAPAVEGSGLRLLERKGDKWIWEGEEIIPAEAMK
ncbi:MAG: sulfatase [Aureliella sp.]